MQYIDKKIISHWQAQISIRLIFYFMKATKNKATTNFDDSTIH